MGLSADSAIERFPDLKLVPGRQKLVGAVREWGFD